MFNVDQGSFQLRSTIGSQQIAGLGFQPKIIRFIWEKRTVDGATSGARYGEGWAISAGSQFCIFNTSEGNVATTDSDKRHVNNKCITTVNNAGTLIEEAALLTMDVDGFTLDVTNASTSLLVSYIAFGGDELTNVKILEFSNPTSVGNVEYTGVGFQPEAYILYTNVDAAASPSTTTGGFLIKGMCDGINQATISQALANGSPTAANEKRILRTDKVIDVDIAGTHVLQAHHQSMDPDGFTLGWDLVNTARKCYAVCFRGGNYQVGAFNQKTSTGAQVISTPSKYPKALFLESANAVANSASQNNVRNSYGVGTSDSVASFFVGSRQGVSPTIMTADIDRTKVLKMMTENGTTPTTQAQCTITSFEDDQINLNWDIADATARQIAFMVIGGEAPVPQAHYKIFADEGLLSRD